MFLAAPVASVDIAFPTGRFSSQPMVNATCTTGGNVAIIVNLGNVTATGFTAFFYGVGGTWTTGAVSLFWHASNAH